MKSIVALILMLIVAPLQANAHKYYFSFTEIYYNTTSSKLEVSVKVFFDDLQEAISAEQGVQIDDPVNNYSKEINQYVQEHFSITGQSTKEKLNWVGVETELDAIWIYYETEPTQFAKHWTVQNSMFVDLFPKQNNIINFYPDKSHPKLVKGLALNRQKTKGEIKF